MIAEGGLRLAQPFVSKQCVYWLEGRASEKGRTVLVRCDKSGSISDITPAPFNVRSGAQEYGGGVYCLDAETSYFVDYPSHALYSRSGAADARLVYKPKTRRLADIYLDKKGSRVLAVSEDHAGKRQPKTTLVAIDMRDGKLTTLARGADFYSSPSLDAAGSRLAWLEWNHPDMPWDANELHVASLPGQADTLASRVVAGGPGESVFQPAWGDDGMLYFMSDRSGWWNLHRWDGKRVEPLMNETADCGFGQWVFGMRSWGFISNNEVLCCGARDGFWSLALVDVRARHTRWLNLPFNTIEHVATAPGRAVVIAAGAEQALSVVDIDIATLDWKILRESAPATLDRSWISVAEPLRFASGNDQAHGFYYPPKHASLKIGQDLPPLLVKCHGGPTAHADAGLDWRIQFWTSRGFAVLNLNYRGSTAFGRAYREKLHGQWGVADVEDALSAARYLVARGLADPKRLAISGGSAGGFTVLCALTFHELFSAGTSLYGVSQLESLLKDTHKFEARYLDRLVGPWPEERALYRERSPLDNAGRIACPVLFLQGLQDHVVTPDQSARMASALRDKGLPVLYIEFADEGHGFRQAASIITALEAELYFYSRIFDFDTPGVNFAHPINNLDD